MLKLFIGHIIGHIIGQLFIGPLPMEKNRQMQLLFDLETEMYWKPFLYIKMQLIPLLPCEDLINLIERKKQEKNSFRSFNLLLVRDRN